jgi:hypothetical protein
MKAIDLESEEILEYLPEYIELLKHAGAFDPDLPRELLLFAAAEQLFKKLQREAFERQFSVVAIEAVPNRWETARQCACASDLAKQRCNGCGWSSCAECGVQGCAMCGRY